MGSHAQGTVHVRDEIGTFKSLAYLPLYGPAVPIPVQTELARGWAERWTRVQPGSQWVFPYTSGQALADESLFARWMAGESQLLRTGALPRQFVQELCRVLNVNALLQGVLGGDLPAAGASMLNGSASSFGLAVRGATGGRATLAYSLVSCRTGATVWSATRHVDYMRDFTAGELAAYAQKNLLDDIPTPP
jgi:hypothetical protein